MMRPNGYVLMTSLIFLVVLTLVAVTALRTSGLELHMSSNNALRTESFESSESPRLLASDLLDAHVFNRGWPAAIGGAVPDAEFAYTIPSGLTIAASSGVPISWYVDNSDETGNCATPFRTAANAKCTLKADATYSRNIATAPQSAFTVRSNVSIFKVRVDLTPGGGTQMDAGYESTGKSAASSGGRIFYYVDSVGRDAAATSAASEAQSETGTMYRSVIRN